MRRPVLAFVAGVLVILALRHITASPDSHDPLPGRAQVAAEIRAVARQARGSQQAPLADGHVDATEYRSAVADRLDCVREHMPEIDVRGPFPIADDRLLTWRYRVGGKPSVRLSEVDRECAEAMSSAIERAWALQAIPQGAARRAEVAALAACFSDHGVVGIRPKVVDVLAAAGTSSENVTDCIDSHAVLFGL